LAIHLFGTLGAFPEVFLEGKEVCDGKLQKQENGNFGPLGHGPYLRKIGVFARRPRENRITENVNGSNRRWRSGIEVAKPSL
jgi:hypothetical protein